MTWRMTWRAILSSFLGGTRVAAAFVRLQLHGRTEGALRDGRENPMAPPIDEDADMVDFGQKVDLCQRIRDVRANHRASNLARTL